GGGCVDVGQRRNVGDRSQEEDDDIGDDVEVGHQVDLARFLGRFLPLLAEPTHLVAQLRGRHGLTSQSRIRKPSACRSAARPYRAAGPTWGPASPSMLSSFMANASSSLACFLAYPFRNTCATIQVTAIPSPIAVLCMASAIPSASRRDRSLGSAW